MLTIRNDQVEHLARVMRRRFVETMLGHLSATYPDRYAACGRDEAAAFVERALDFGKLHRIEGQWAVATLVELRIELGEAFERSPKRTWASEILTHATMPEWLKMKLLSERLRPPPAPVHASAPRFDEPPVSEADESDRDRT
jgi:hypothetical protein